MKKFYQKTVTCLLAVLVVASVATMPVSANAWFGAEDGDETCNVKDQLASGVTLMWYSDDDCFETPSANVTEGDAEQTKIDLLSSAEAAKTNSDIYMSSIKNHLQDTETTALIKGKNAYIRALNNGSSKVTAKRKARIAVGDYYAVKQKNLVQSWNSQIIHGRYMHDVAANASGVSPGYVSKVTGNTGVISTDHTVTWQNRTKSFELVNTSSVDVRQVKIHTDAKNNYGNEIGSQTKQFDITTGSHTAHSGLDAGNIQAIAVAAPNSNHNQLEYIRFSDYSSRWSQIESQHSDVKDQVFTFIDQTYDSYQTGQIENSDLVDPYVMQQEYSPNDDFQTWAVSSLTTMGLNSPENMSSFAYVNLTYSGADYQGVLMSDSNPADGSFERGSTYNASAITGQQYIVTSGSFQELEGNFTITDIRSSEGQQVSNVTIKEKNYSTADITEYQQTMNDLQKDRAEWEAWKKEQQSSSGGALLLNGDNSTVILLITALGGVLLLLRESGDK